MGTVRCKFRCNEVAKRHHKEAGKPDSFLYTAKFSAVYSGSPENQQFFKWTPNGQLEIGVYKEDAFEPGKEYYLDISLAAQA